MTPEVASLLLRCLAAMADEGIGPRSYNWTIPDECPGDDQLYAQAVKVIGEENVSHWELLEIIPGLREKGLL